MPISNESIEREGGIYEKTLNQSFTLLNDGYDVINIIAFHLTVTSFPTTIMTSSFFAEFCHVFAREVEKKRIFSFLFPFILEFLKPYN
jgi:hypothetical protein